MVGARRLTIGLWVLILTLFTIYISTGQTKAAPEINCSNTSHTILAVDNAQSGNGDVIRIICLSDDSSQTSTPTVGSGGQDVQVVCKSGNFSVSTGNNDGVDYIEATCTGDVQEYFNGTELRTLGADGNFTDDPLELPPDISTGQPADGSLAPPSLNGAGNNVDENLYCGKGEENRVKIGFDIGCIGDRYTGENYNPILDMMFALLRFVSLGVGIVVAGSIVWAGIQYSTSRGNPQSTEASLKRVTNAVIALLIYIFSFAILNFLVPGGLFI